MLCLSFYYAAVYLKGPFLQILMSSREIFLHYLCNNFLPSLASFSKNISNSPPVFGLILHLPLGESCCLQIPIPGKERYGNADFTKCPHSGQAALSAIALSSQSGCGDQATAPHLHNQAESGFPVNPLFFFPTLLPLSPSLFFVCLPHPFPLQPFDSPLLSSSSFSPKLHHLSVF